MKKLILLLILGFGFFSCAKKEEEIIDPNIICEICTHNYTIKEYILGSDTAFSIKTKNVIFENCAYTKYETTNGITILPIYDYDSLGYIYEKGWKEEHLINWSCVDKK